MITVHGLHTEQNDFNNCGLAIIKPTSAIITEELNGRYDMEIEVPCVPDDPRSGRHEDTWKNIQMYNILKSSEGQLFQINRIQYIMKNGVPYIKAYAPHIWYYLSDMLTIECGDTRSLYWTLADLFTERDAEGHGSTKFSHGTGLTDYNFSFSTDFDHNDLRTYKYRMISLGSAILGNSDSVVNLWNGELHRDNFRFSINQRKEGSVDDAFELVYGANCRDVQYTASTENRKTEYVSYVNGGMWYRGQSIVPDLGTFPHQAIAGIDLSYSDPNEDIYNRDLSQWWSENVGWIKNWTVDYVDFRLTNKGANWDQVRKIRVGDQGRVKDGFGNSDTQKVIATRYNDITGRLEGLTLGTFVESQLHTSRWDKKILTSNDNPEVKRIENVERQLGGVGGDITHIADDVSNMSTDIGNINNSITDINAAIQDIYSRLPQNP